MSRSLLLHLICVLAQIVAMTSQDEPNVVDYSSVQLGKGIDQQQAINISVTSLSTQVYESYSLRMLFLVLFVITRYSVCETYLSRFSNVETT